MSEPLVSVVMVVCNVERFLAEAIESVLGQTFHAFEFIIVDFGSTDKSQGIASSYAAKDARIRLHQIPHCGLAEARNAGCFLARGRYIAIQDADDISLPDRLLWQTDFMEKHAGVGLLGGGGVVIEKEGQRLFAANGEAFFGPDYPSGDKEIRQAMVSGCPFWQPTVLMRRSIFAAVGGYRPPFAPAEDYDLWVRISEHCDVANLAAVVSKYRIHSNQVSVRKQKQQTLGTLAARASAASRKDGHADPFDSVQAITPDVLVGLGVSEATQQSALALKYSDWIRAMCGVREWSVALDTAIEMLRSSDWKCLEPRAIADMRLTAAGLYWKNNRFLNGILTAAHAVITRPVVVGRPLRPLLRRFGVK